LANSQQYLVPDQVAEGVVDGLEAVDVQHRQVVPAELVLDPAAPRDWRRSQHFRQVLFSRRRRFIRPVRVSFSLSFSRRTKF
jgi:hypothetical protein